MTPVTVFLGLGSNQGDREAYLNGAVRSIRHFCTNVQVSSFWDTDPMYDVNQPRFLNAVVRGETTLGPRALLWACQQLEHQAGRRRTTANGPRTLDIDILYYGQLMVSDPDLTIPHPLLHERPFVTGPLKEIAPDWGGCYQPN
jgi:2-amino-4-hydroxy-6-hydroxymethyldihydropteridine diphosphokinase